MSDEEEGCTLALDYRRRCVLDVLLRLPRIPVAEALETAATVPAHLLRYFYGARLPRADRPGAGRRRGVFTAGRR